MFTPTYYLTVFTVAIGASTQFYSFGIVNPVQTIIMEWVNTTYSERYNYPLNLTQLNLLWSFVVSSIAVGAIIGALLTRTLSDKCGRRNALIINGMINVVGGILELVSKNFLSPELLILGRTILGFNMGLGSGLVPMYLMEITPAKYRGAAGTVHQVAVAFGDWFSLFMGLPIAFGTERYWPVAFAFPGFLALILCIILPFCPESPKYNLLCGGDYARIADNDVRRLLAKEEDAREFSHDIRLEIPNDPDDLENSKYSEFFKRPALRRAMIAAIFVMIAQQFTGCTAVFAYSTDMFMNAKLSLDTARYSTLGMGIMYFLCASLSPFLIDRVGRKGLSLFQLSSCLLALIMLSVFTYLQQSVALDWARYGSVFALIFFMCVYGVGSPIPWMITSELFTTKYRSAAVTITVSVAWFLAFVLSTAYLPFQQLVGVSFSYLPFIVVVSISICVMYNILPETKDRSASDINREIRSRMQSVMSGGAGESENLPLLGEDVDDEFNELDDAEDHTAGFAEGWFDLEEVMEELGNGAVHRTCVKCTDPGLYHGLDAKKAVYCKPCFITMVKHKFSSTIGKKRIFKGDASKETLVVYEGDISSGFMLWLIQQGLSVDVHKKLQLQPVVLVLLTQPSEQEVQEFIQQVSSILHILRTDWYFVHISTLLDDQFQPSTSAPSLKALNDWNKLCASFKSNTARQEFERLSRTAVCLRTAKLLGLNKVMLADNADALSKDSLNSLCLGRGSSLGDITGVVDKRHPDVAIIRPLRDVSLMEISTVNEMHDNGNLVIKKNDSTPPLKKAIQPLSEGLIEDLQSNGFKSTITTILSVASKVKALHPGEQKCGFCYTLYPLEEDGSIMISRQVLKRGFATAAARSPLAAVSDEKVSRLQNGLTVASVDVGGPVSNLVLAFRAGARYESADEAGLVHHLRNLIGTDSSNFLGAKMLWQAGSIGAQLNSTATNDLLLVQMSVIRDNAEIALSLLGELAQPACKPWDVEDRKETLSHDRAYRTSYEILLEHLHKAAYRNGALGNRVTAKSHRVGKINYRQIADFADARLRTGEAALVGINVDHGNLLRYASEQLRLTEGTAKAAVASPYLGGDVRHDAAGDFAHIALVGEGVGLSDAKNVAVQSVLAGLIGNGSNLKYSNGVGPGVVAQAVQKAANGQLVGVTSINISHSDTGLAGVYLVAEGSRVAPVVTAAAGALKNLAGSVDEQALAIAKATAKVNVLTRADESAALAVDQATQLLASGNAVSPADFAKLIDGVTAADVKKAAEQLAKKLSLAAHGRVNQVPYLDQL